MNVLTARARPGAFVVRSRRTAPALAATVVGGRVRGWRVLAGARQEESGGHGDRVCGYITAVALAVPLLMALGTWSLKGRRDPGGTRGHARAGLRRGRLARGRHGRQQAAAARRIVTSAPATVRWRWAAGDITASRLDVADPPRPGRGLRPCLISGRQENCWGLGR